MDSPVDSLGLGDDLGFLDSIFSQEPASEHQNLDLSYLLNSDPLPAARSSTTDREELLRAALRSHQDAVIVPAAAPAAHGPQRLSSEPLKQVDNNAAACTSSAVAAPALPAAAAAKPPLPTSMTAVIKPEPVFHQEISTHYDDAFETDSDAMPAKGGGKGSTTKRRRRIRNAKQQELNRLAQQRYRERKKQKYSNLQGTVDELSMRLSQLNTLEAANSELQQRNGQLETVVKQQQEQLHQQQETISKQAQQLQTQAQQLHHQAQQLQTQVQHIEQQDKQVAELKRQLASQQQAVASDTEQLNDQLALAVRAVLTGVSTMTSMLPAKDAQQMQQMVTTLPDSILQQIRSCCREVALHLKKTEVKEQPHAIQVPCC